MNNSISNNNGNNHPQQYLKNIENVALKRMDIDNNGKVTVNEALKDLNIGSLLYGQNAKDTSKINTAAKNIKQTLKQYAGTDGIFNANEWADFINGPE